MLVDIKNLGAMQLYGNKVTLSFTSWEAASLFFARMELANFDKPASETVIDVVPTSVQVKG